MMWGLNDLKINEKDYVKHKMFVTEKKKKKTEGEDVVEDEDEKKIFFKKTIIKNEEVHKVITQMELKNVLKY